MTPPRRLRDAPPLDVWAYDDPATEREYALAGFQSSETSGGGLYVSDVDRGLFVFRLE